MTYRLRHGSQGQYKTNVLLLSATFIPCMFLLASLMINLRRLWWEGNLTGATGIYVQVCCQALCSP